MFDLLIKKEKKRFFSSFVSEKKKSFWDACKPYLSGRNTYSQRSFALSESNSMVNDDSAIANIFNNFFVNITDHLNLFCWKSH